jgi:hypothetical protein
MRYFLTTNASRSFTTGGFAFSKFEPVGQRGGSWLGVLEVADEAASSALAAAIQGGTVSGIDEISVERFDTLKKKGSASSTTLIESQQRSPQTPGVNARPAEPHGAPPVSNSTENITAVTLAMGTAFPPREPLLDEPAIKRVRRGK